MIFRTICLIFLSALFTSCSSTTVRIHPRSPEDKIRNVVLQHTPLGSSPESVMSFIETRLRLVVAVQFGWLGLFRLGIVSNYAGIGLLLATCGLATWLMPYFLSVRLKPE